MISGQLSYRAITTFYGAWLILWTLLHAWVLVYTIDVTWEIAAKDAALNNALLAIAGYGMINITRFYQPRQFLRLIYSIALSVACIVVFQWLAKSLISQETDYTEFLKRSFLIRGVFAWLIITLIAALSWLWFYIREQQEIVLRKETNEKLAREAELAKLRQQLQPHFLFNSLNSISALAGSRPEEARKMIQQLSDFLRSTLKKDEQQLITFSEELENLQLYLEIEKVRFGHRLKTNIEYIDDALALKLPSLLLQPIVENAIKFGLYDTTGEITISVIAKHENNYLVMSVHNPFDASTSQPRQGTGFGLNSVQRRLYLLYARQDLLQTSNDGFTFTTQIKIPQSA